MDAIYNPLPNHLHVPWTVRAAEAGKHVLCEKPVALSAAEAAQLVAVRDRTGVLIQEAFMVRSHPQWLAARELVRSGRIGEARSFTGFFSYYNDDPANIRNVAGWGGGGLMDIGCYLVNTSRFIFDREPLRVCAMMQRDPRTAIDRVTSMMLDFGAAQAIGTCSTQLVAHQRVEILGTERRLELPIPFNAPPDQPTRLFVHDGSDPTGTRRETHRVRDLRPIHDPGRPAVPRHPRRWGGALPARGLDSQHARHRRAGPVLRSRGVGIAVKHPSPRPPPNPKTGENVP